MVGTNLKSLIASFALVGASALSASAASVVYDNNFANGVQCSFATECTFALAGSDDAAGTMIRIAVVPDGDNSITTDNTRLEFGPAPFGLGIGFRAQSAGSPISIFAAEIELEVIGEDLTWIGGGFKAVESASPSDPTAGINISGPGLNKTVFETQADVNPGRSTTFTPVSFSLAGQGINFLADQTYILSLGDYALASSQSTDAFIQFSSMEFVTTASIPLPGTAWMMIGALGFLGWRKYRTA